MKTNYYILVNNYFVLVRLKKKMSRKEDVNTGRFEVKSEGSF